MQFFRCAMTTVAALSCCAAAYGACCKFVYKFEGLDQNGDWGSACVGTTGSTTTVCESTVTDTTTEDPLAKEYLPGYMSAQCCKWTAGAGGQFVQSGCTGVPDPCGGSTRQLVGRRAAGSCCWACGIFTKDCEANGEITVQQCFGTCSGGPTQ